MTTKPNKRAFDFGWLLAVAMFGGALLYAAINLPAGICK